MEQQTVTLPYVTCPVMQRLIWTCARLEAAARNDGRGVAFVEGAMAYDEGAMWQEVVGAATDGSSGPVELLNSPRARQAGASIFARRMLRLLNTQIMDWWRQWRPRTDEVVD